MLKDIRYGTSTPPQYLEPREDTVPFVRASDIKNGEISLDNIYHISKTQPITMGKCRLCGGELIIVRSGVNTGDCATVPSTLSGAYAAYDLILTLNESLSVQYLCYFLDSSIGRLQLNIVKGRAAQPHINADEVKDLRIPVPPLQIQHKLVADMTSAAEKRRAKLTKADALLAGMDDFVCSELGVSMPTLTPRLGVAVTMAQLKADNAFNVEYYNAERTTIIDTIKTVPYKRLGDCADFMRDLASATDNWYLGLAGVQSNTGELSGADEEATGQAFSFREGDVLYGRLRPYLNKIWKAEHGGVCSTEFHVIRMKSDEVLPDYLAVVMRSQLILRQTRHMMTGNTHPRIGNEDVANLLIPVPSKDIQRKVATEMRSRQNAARSKRTEAETEWAAAKARFERELLGGAI
jgi:hypothetical protein